MATPVARLPPGIVAAKRQWFKARVGFPSCETDLDRSVCAYALSEPDLLIIPDLSTDPRTRTNPLVTGEPNIRFYAGAPLRTATGRVLGSLCVIDHQPRPEGLTKGQQDALRRLARQVMILLRERRQLAKMQAAEVLARAATTRRLALIELGDELRDLSTIAEMTAKAAEIVGRTLNVSRAGYGELDGTGQVITIPEDWAVPGEVRLIGRHRFADYGTVGPGLGRGETLVVTNVEADARTAGYAAPFTAINVRAMLNVPVRERGRTVGLFFAHSSTIREWAPEEVAFACNVADRVQVGIARLRAEEQRAILNGELSHRLKNTLAMVQGIAGQTLRSVPDQTPITAFTERLIALSRAHDVLIQDSWAAAPIRAVVEKVLPLQVSLDRFHIDGPNLALSPQATLSLSLLLHELTTNAVKYGALSTDEGSVRLSWRIEADAEQTVVLNWQERGGPAAVAPMQQGFGTRLIQSGLVGTRDTCLSYEAAGLDAEFRAPISQVVHRDRGKCRSSKGDRVTSSTERRPVVVLIENEPLLTLVLSDLIEEAGCSVVEATATAEAIRILEQRTDIRVVVADLDVRGSVAGLKLAALIRDRWPPIELILKGAVKPELTSIPARSVFHDKPFDYAGIVRSIRIFATDSQ